MTTTMTATTHFGWPPTDTGWGQNIVSNPLLPPGQAWFVTDGSGNVLEHTVTNGAYYMRYVNPTPVMAPVALPPPPSLATGLLVADYMSDIVSDPSPFQTATERVYQSMLGQLGKTKDWDFLSVPVFGDTPAVTKEEDMATNPHPYEPNTCGCGACERTRAIQAGYYIHVQGGNVGVGGSLSSAADKFFADVEEHVTPDYVWGPAARVVLQRYVATVDWKTLPKDKLAYFHAIAMADEQFCFGFNGADKLKHYADRIGFFSAVAHGLYRIGSLRMTASLVEQIVHSCNGAYRALSGDWWSRCDTIIQYLRDGSKSAELAKYGVTLALVPATGSEMDKLKANALALIGIGSFNSADILGLAVKAPKGAREMRLTGYDTNGHMQSEVLAEGAVTKRKWSKMSLAVDTLTGEEWPGLIDAMNDALKAHRIKVEGPTAHEVHAAMVVKQSAHADARLAVKHAKIADGWKAHAVAAAERNVKARADKANDPCAKFPKAIGSEYGESWLSRGMAASAPRSAYETRMMTPVREMIATHFAGEGDPEEFRIFTRAEANGPDGRDWSDF